MGEGPYGRRSSVTRQQGFLTGFCVTPLSKCLPVHDLERYLERCLMQFPLRCAMLSLERLLRHLSECSHWRFFVLVCECSREKCLRFRPELWAWAFRFAHTRIQAPVLRLAAAIRRQLFAFRRSGQESRMVFCPQRGGPGFSRLFIDGAESPMYNKHSRLAQSGRTEGN